MIQQGRLTRNLNGKLPPERTDVPATEDALSLVKYFAPQPVVLILQTMLPRHSLSKQMQKLGIPDRLLWPNGLRRLLEIARPQATS